MAEVKALLCPQCGSKDLEEIGGDRRRCRYCGTEVRLSRERTRVELLQWVCPRCGANNAVGANYCRQCGAVLAQQCTNCGQEEYIGSQFCPNCGQLLRGPAPVPEARTTAASLEAKPPPKAKLPVSGWAYASLITAMLGLGLVAVICGHVAPARIRRGEGRRRGIAIAGLVLGYLQCLLLCLAWVLAQGGAH